MMIRGFVLQRVSAFLGGGSSNSPMGADTQKDSNRHAHHEKAAEAKDDEPPDHPHDELGYQTLVGVRRRTLRQNASFYLGVPFADLEDSWNAATLFLSMSTEPVSTNAGIGAKLSRDQSVSSFEGLLW
jgi:hypothetical protein